MSEYIEVINKQSKHVLLRRDIIVAVEELDDGRAEIVLESAGIRDFITTNNFYTDVIGEIAVNFGNNKVTQVK